MNELCILCIGLCIGSFLNVLCYRLPYHLDFIFDRSKCVSCKHELNWLDLIPVFSFILLKGRCRYCKEVIRIQYPIVELLSMGLLLYLYERYGISFYSIYLYFIGCLFIVISVIDLQHFIILDECLISLGILVLMYSIHQHLLFDIINLVSMCIVPIILLVCNKIKDDSFGGGDIKLYFICGYLLGIQILDAFIITLLMTSIIGIYFVYKKQYDAHIAFAPSICLGCFITLLL